MGTLERHFTSRVSAFLRRTGWRPTTFGIRALGDPNLIRQIGEGRSLTLRNADRILDFTTEYDAADAVLNTADWQGGCAPWNPPNVRALTVRGRRPPPIPPQRQPLGHMRRTVQPSVSPRRMVRGGCPAAYHD